MTDFYYPKLEEGALRTAKKLADSHPDYLSDPKCPYSQETKDLLKPAVVKEEKAKTATDLLLAEIDFTTATDDSVLDEINRIYNQLRQIGANMGSADDDTDASAKNTYFRLSLQMMEKVVEMRTELTNNMNLTKFMSAVMDCMEDLLDADERNIFMDRIKKAGEK